MSRCSPWLSTATAGPGVATGRHRRRPCRRLEPHLRRRQRRYDVHRRRRSLLDEIANVAADAGVWLHVDGAYGAPAAADPASRHLFAGMHRADSLCVDAHKWLYAPVDCSALLLHDAAATARAFGADADDVCVLATQREETFAFWDHGLELSRRFRALKLWTTLRFHGARRRSAAIGEDIRLAAHLADLVADAEDFELLAGPG